MLAVRFALVQHFTAEYEGYFVRAKIHSLKNEGIEAFKKPKWWKCNRAIIRFLMDEQECELHQLEKMCEAFQ